ncbi:hypothetical protein GCM10028803_22800 [Larkinella knui]|uniref:Outer membrane protein beta-barrel domain-containing protein n=1 Tax=Larkinella knui TaxID=2025310 RepID=A0A3P1CVN5_9BACT|nr:hypothetical protein [Larkinella knui]RRB17353.1 hypothetical protein EHT87_03450 [Larkinella knui]
MKTTWLKTLICILGTTVFAPAVAQQRNRFLGISAGVAPLQIKDQLHSPYTYRGTGLKLRVVYEQERPQTQWQLETGFTQVNPQSVVSRKAASRSMDVILNYRWRLSPADKPENRLQYFGGAGLRLLGNSTNYSPDTDVATVLTTAAVSLGASAQMSYRFSPAHRLQIQAFASAASAVYRPDYAYYGKEQFSVSWLGKNQMADVQVSYQYQFRKNFCGMATYQLSYFKYGQPRPVIWLQQSFGVGIQRSF